MSNSYKRYITVRSRERETTSSQIRQKLKNIDNYTNINHKKFGQNIIILSAYPTRDAVNDGREFYHKINK